MVTEITSLLGRGLALSQILSAARRLEKNAFSTKEKALLGAGLALWAAWEYRKAKS